MSTRDERLFHLIEELGKLQQALAKVGRFGMHSHHPKTKLLNVDAVLHEMTHVAIAMAELRPDLDKLYNSIHAPKEMLYCGSDDRLKGQSALVRWDPYQSDTVLVQFTDITLGDLAHGWHRYPENEFRNPEDPSAHGWFPVKDPRSDGYEVQYQPSTGACRHRFNPLSDIDLEIGWRTGKVPEGDEWVSIIYPKNFDYEVEHQPSTGAYRHRFNPFHESKLEDEWQSGEPPLYGAPSEKTYTRADVGKALQNYARKHGVAAAIKIKTEVGGETILQIPEDKFAAVIAACKEAG